MSSFPCKYCDGDQIVCVTCSVDRTAELETQLAECTAQLQQERESHKRDELLADQIISERRREIEQLEESLKQARQEASLQTQMVAAIKHSVVATVGGVDSEGFPTSEINYLQRLRILVAKEAALQTAQSALSNIRTWAKHYPSSMPEIAREAEEALTKLKLTERKEEG